LQVAVLKKIAGADKSTHPYRKKLVKRPLFSDKFWLLTPGS